MSELKACPFCGGNPEIIRIGNDYTKSRKITIRCPKCRIERTNATIRHNFEWVENISIEAWNLRPIEDALSAENAKLRKALEQIAYYDRSGFDWMRSYYGTKQIAQEALKNE